MIAILGAGGAIGDGLAKMLLEKNQAVRVVARNPKAIDGAQSLAADLSDAAQTRAAVEGSQTACLVAGLPYDLAVWREQWPRIMRNVIEACKHSGTRLLFFDNVYMYGRVDGPMTEATPYRPSSKKGEIRAAIATLLMDEARAGNLQAMIARAADFYGPQTKNGIPNVLVLEPYAKGGTASWLVNARVPHSLTFTPDAARGVAMLIERDSAWNQVWHLPTTPDPPTGQAFIRNGGRRVRRCAEVSSARQADAQAGRSLQPCGARIGGDALSKRTPLHLRLVEVRRRVRLLRNALRRRHSHRRAIISKVISISQHGLRLARYRAQYDGRESGVYRQRDSSMGAR